MILYSGLLFWATLYTGLTISQQNDIRHNFPRNVLRSAKPTLP